MMITTAMNDPFVGEDERRQQLEQYFEQVMHPMRPVDSHSCVYIDIGHRNLHISLVRLNGRPLPKPSLDNLKREIWLPKEGSSDADNGHSRRPLVEILGSFHVDLLADNGVAPIIQSYTDPQLLEYGRVVQEIEKKRLEAFPYSPQRPGDGALQLTVPALRQALWAQGHHEGVEKDAKFLRWNRALAYLFSSCEMAWLWYAPWPISLEPQCDQVKEKRSPREKIFVNFNLSQMIIANILARDYAWFGFPRVVTFASTKYGAEECKHLVRRRTSDPYKIRKEASVVWCERLCNVLQLPEFASYLRSLKKADDAAETITGALGRLYRTTGRARSLTEVEKRRLLDPPDHYYHHHCGGGGGGGDDSSGSCSRRRRCEDEGEAGDNDVDADAESIHELFADAVGVTIEEASKIAAAAATATKGRKKGRTAAAANDGKLAEPKGSSDETRAWPKDDIDDADDVAADDKPQRAFEQTAVALSPLSSSSSSSSRKRKRTEITTTATPSARKGKGEQRESTASGTKKQPLTQQRRRRQPKQPAESTNSPVVLTKTMLNPYMRSVSAFGSVVAGNSADRSLPTQQQQQQRRQKAFERPASGLRGIYYHSSDSAGSSSGSDDDDDDLFGSRSFGAREDDRDPAVAAAGGLLRLKRSKRAKLRKLNPSQTESGPGLLDEDETGGGDDDDDDRLLERLERERDAIME
jgi:hypothetical protein